MNAQREQMHLRDQLRKLLTEYQERSPLPELTSQSPEMLRQTSSAQRLLEGAREALEQPVPETTFTLYDWTLKTGEREPYQDACFGKRELLGKMAILVWLEDDAKALERLCDLIWSVCEETTWVIPAHFGGPPWDIDLTAAETGGMLAEVYGVLGDKLPRRISERIYQEVNRRIFQCYLENISRFKFEIDRDNWTGVCAGSIGKAFLWLERDFERLLNGIEKVYIDITKLYLPEGFEPDGGSVEGIGYWGYGLLHTVMFAEMLRSRTGGAIDILGSERMQQIANFPQAIAVGRCRFANFADSREESALPDYLMDKLAERTGVEGLRAHVNHDPGWGFSQILRKLLWVKTEEPAELQLTDQYLPSSQIAKRVVKLEDHTLAMVAKAGHNNETHNHNDVGQFIFSVDGNNYLCDPGPPRYTMEFMHPSTRYNNLFANSYGHNVPVINGKLQGLGEHFRGMMQPLEHGTVQIEMAKAYKAPELESLVRSLRFDEEGTLYLHDSIRLSEPGTIEEGFVTWFEASAEGAIARIEGPVGTVEIRCEGAEFRVETLEKESKANHKPGILKRISATFAEARQFDLRFTIRFVMR